HGVLVSDWSPGVCSSDLFLGPPYFCRVRPVGWAALFTRCRVASALAHGQSLPNGAGRTLTGTADRGSAGSARRRPVPAHGGIPRSGERRVRGEWMAERRT